MQNIFKLYDYYPDFYSIYPYEAIKMVKFLKDHRTHKITSPFHVTIYNTA